MFVDAGITFEFDNLNTLIFFDAETNPTMKQTAYHDYVITIGADLNISPEHLTLTTVHPPTMIDDSTEDHTDSTID